MELNVTQSPRKYPDVSAALFLTAVFAVVLATLDWLYLLPAALIGVLPVFLPKRYRKFLWIALAVFLLIRFAAIWDGMKILANRAFWISEQVQSYAYTYFHVSGERCTEAVIFLSVLAGLVHCPAILAGVWIIAMAYFGISPDAIWLVLLLVVGLAACLPRNHRWFYGLLVGILSIAIALAVTQVAPEPGKSLSELDEQLRDSLAFATVAYEQEPVPMEVPEPEIVPQPETLLEQPDHGVQKAVINVLFFVLAALTLALLFIPAIIKDRAAKRSEQARTGLEDPDHGTAIRAMYLYAQRWRSLSGTPMEIPAAVYAIWQEAAFSDHTMTADQRETVHQYMVETAHAVWNAADRKKKLHIRYRICL